jgi:hypothetical protein
MICPQRNEAMKTVRQLTRPYSVRLDSESITVFSLAAKFAIVCHSIANSSQSRFEVGWDASLARCSQAIAFARYISVRLLNCM